MRISIILNVVVALLFLSSCTKDEADNNSGTGGWKVTVYHADGNTKTGLFTGYIFDFENNGQATATKGSEVVSGFWKEIVDSGRTKFVLDFNKSGIFEEISEDWTVVTKTDTSIKLTHNSANSSSLSGETLEFGR